MLLIKLRFNKGIQNINIYEATLNKPLPQNIYVWLLTAN